MVSGWLYKEKVQGKYMFGKTRKRYFVLNDFEIQWYKHVHDLDANRKPAGVVQLKHAHLSWEDGRLVLVSAVNERLVMSGENIEDWERAIHNKVSKLIEPRASRMNSHYVPAEASSPKKVNMSLSPSFGSLTNGRPTVVSSNGPAFLSPFERCLKCFSLPGMNPPPINARIPSNMREDDSNNSATSMPKVQSFHSLQLALSSLSPPPAVAIQPFVTTEPSYRVPPPNMERPVIQRTPSSYSKTATADGMWATAEETQEDEDYEAVLKYLEEVAANDPELLWRLARSCKACASLSANVEAGKSETLMHEGLEAAKRAVKIDPSSYKVFLWVGIMLGEAQLETVEVTERLNREYKVRDSLKRATELNPADAESQQ